MDRDAGREDEELLLSMAGPVEIADASTIVRPLERALEHTEGEEAKYWIRTALQHLVAEDADVD